MPWAYEDSYFNYRGRKHRVVNHTDNLVLDKQGDKYCAAGTFTTELLRLPPAGFFDGIEYEGEIPRGTSLA